jgi:hypothetical protein
MMKDQGRHATPASPPIPAQRSALTPMSKVGTSVRWCNDAAANDNGVVGLDLPHSDHRHVFRR